MVNAHDDCIQILFVIRQSGAIHQPYFTLLGVEALRFEVRSYNGWLHFPFCIIT